MVTTQHSNRRELLLQEMGRLAKEKIDCRNCVGHCCTSRGNSMMITLKEARDIKSHLILSELWTEDLISRLKNCIKDYRLDIEIPQFGQRRNLRRTYTCPFYKGTSLGCQLPPEVKPYGCLAFNPKTINARGESGQCESNQALLEQQMTLSIESQDLELKDENIKLPIPMALLRWD